MLKWKFLFLFCTDKNQSKRKWVDSFLQIVKLFLFTYISILGRHVSIFWEDLFHFSHVSCLPFPLLISIPLLKQVLSDLPRRTALLWQSIGNFPRRPYLSVCEFCFHRCPSHQMHQSGSSAVEVGFCLGPGSHIWFVLIVQITAASLGREFLSSLTLRRGLKNSFVIHGVFSSPFSVVLQKEKILHRHIWFLMDVFRWFVQMVIFKWRAFRICEKTRSGQKDAMVSCYSIAYHKEIFSFCTKTLLQCSL